MTAQTGLEIFTQANDLQIIIGESEGKHAVVLSRGPGHRFKLLLSSEPVFDTRDDAVESIIEVLKFTCEKAKETLTDPTNILASIVNPANLSVEQMQNVLTDEHLRRIEEELRANGVANTYEMVFA